jgi:S-adenosylmethionine/arginine decarboxylase-like enzyme
MSNWQYNGLHLIYDAGAKPVVSSDRTNPLNDPSMGHKVVSAIVDAIDMTLIVPPLTVEFPHNKCELQRVLQRLEAEGLAGSATAQFIEKALKERAEQTYGYSTIAMIAESHIAFHTFPEQGFVTADVYSCKDFDTKAVEDIFDRMFFPEKSLFDFEKNVHVVRRVLDLSRFME